MKIAMICFTLTGLQTAERIRSAFLLQKSETIEIFVKSKYLENSIRESIGEWAGKQFEEKDVLLFIGATGIAVRSIAPYVTSKKTDPAVLCVDECGTYVISLLSGHLGGANDLALFIAKKIGAIPVVTTATDLHGRFAVDVFAKKNNCSIFYMKAAKEVSAALLAGEKVGFYSEMEYDLPLPEGLIPCDRYGKPLKHVWKSEKDVSDGASGSEERIAIGIAVTVSKNVRPFAQTAVVVPKVLVMGIGCRKGKEAEGVKAAALACLNRGNYYKEAVCMISSIDLKKEESGILSLAEEWKIPFLTYTEGELLSVPGDFTASAFVKKITGVDNVCERSAILGAGMGSLLQKKVGADGVTTALARKKEDLHFE